MTDGVLTTEAVVLRRRNSGEKGILLTLLSADLGLVPAFKRTSSRGRQPLPDLFDEAAVTVKKARSGELWFADEYIVRRRRSALGAHIAAFGYACRYALLLSHHVFAADEAPLWKEQLNEALDAWESGVRPDVVWLKALYRFAQLQGMPVKEEWLHALNDRDRDHARSVLRLPLREQVVPVDVVERLAAGFAAYLEHSHDVRFTD